MRKIINSTHISLDGVIEAPHTWPPTGPDDERAGAIQTELLLSCDAVLMGRIVGRGGPGDLLYGEVPLTRFELLDTTPLKSGTVVLSYRAAA